MRSCKIGFFVEAYGFSVELTQSEASFDTPVLMWIYSKLDSHGILIKDKIPSLSNVLKSGLNISERPIKAVVYILSKLIKNMYI